MMHFPKPKNSRVGLAAIVLAIAGCVGNDAANPTKMPTPEEFTSSSTAADQAVSGDAPATSAANP